MDGPHHRSRRAQGAVGLKIAGSGQVADHLEIIVGLPVVEQRPGQRDAIGYPVRSDDERRDVAGIANNLSVSRSSVKYFETVEDEIPDTNICRVEEEPDRQSAAIAICRDAVGVDRSRNPEKQ